MGIGRIIVVIFCVKCFCGDVAESRDTWMGSKDGSGEYWNPRSSRVQRSLVQSEKPKLSVCCPPGSFMNSSETIDCLSNTSKPISDPEVPRIFRENLKPSDKGPQDFQRVYRIPCKNGFYEMSSKAPLFDVFYLLEDGRIYQDNSKYKVPNAFLGHDEFCLSSWMGDNGTYTRIIACYPPVQREIPLAYTISLVMSMPFLAATFLVYAFLPELRNIHGMTLMPYVASMFWGYMGLVVVQFGGASPWHHTGFCIFSAFIIHFSFLSSFFWLNVMCFDIWWTFGRKAGQVVEQNGGFRALQGSVKQRERKKFIIYSVYAWGSASLITGVCLIMDFVPNIPDSYIKPRFGETRCWFPDEISKAVYFYGPMGVTVVCNIFLFISTALKILQHKRDTATQLKGIDSRRHDDNKQWFNLYLKLFIVMGINWSMEIISWLLNKDTPQYVWYLTDLANTLQGVIIFIIFVWKDKIRRLLMKRFGCQKGKFQSGNSTRSGYHSSASNKTCTSIALQDKIPGERNRVNTTTDESDCV
ncbi:G-protein coupled receptor Mth2 [Diachasma alloeum]|uniref:G-protein coupled receptor Mth2 n=1 Tax=Diachasma alloeum TaxID=454923 RepID=UPI0010FADB57|nr:G-protein coupled receptor Mth2 [Diachasma alloeum]XP_028981832.1 G-protein coupled receptor Mth2 [Diachasma alloeum]